MKTEGVKIGINRTVRINCIASKCHLSCTITRVSETFSAALVLFDAIPASQVSKHCSVGLILLQRRSSDAVAAQRRCIPKCAVKTSATIITPSLKNEIYLIPYLFWRSACVILLNFLAYIQNLEYAGTVLYNVSRSAVCSPKTSDINQSRLLP